MPDVQNKEAGKYIKKTTEGSGKEYSLFTCLIALILPLHRPINWQHKHHQTNSNPWPQILSDKHTHRERERASEREKRERDGCQIKNVTLYLAVFLRNNWKGLITFPEMMKQEQKQSIYMHTDQSKKYYKTISYKCIIFYLI